MIDPFILKLAEGRYGEFDEADLAVVAGNPGVFDCPKSFRDGFLKYPSMSDEERTEFRESVKGFLPFGTVALRRIEESPVPGLPDFRGELFNRLRAMDSYQLCFFVDRIGRLTHDEKLHFFGPARNEAIAYHALNRAAMNEFHLTLAFQFFGKNERENFLLADYGKFDRAAMIAALESNLRRYSYILLEVAEAVLSYGKGLDTKGFTQYVNKAIHPYVRMVNADKLESKVRKGSHKFGQTWALDLGDDDEEE